MLKIEHPALGNYYISHEDVEKYAVMRKTEPDPEKTTQVKDQLLVRFKTIEDAIRYLVEKILLDIELPNGAESANLNAILAYRDNLVQMLTHRPERRPNPEPETEVPEVIEEKSEVESNVESVEKE